MECPTRAYVPETGLRWPFVEMAVSGPEPTEDDLLSYGERLDLPLVPLWRRLMAAFGL